MTDNRNTIIAVILSGLVLIGWQYFFNIPQMEKQRAAEQAQSELAKANKTTPATTTPAGSASTPATPGAAPTTPTVNQPATATIVSRDAAISGSPRIKIETPRLAGSVSLAYAKMRAHVNTNGFLIGYIVQDKKGREVCRDPFVQIEFRGPDSYITCQD